MGKGPPALRRPRSSVAASMMVRVRCEVGFTDVVKSQLLQSGDPAHASTTCDTNFDPNASPTATDVVEAQLLHSGYLAYQHSAQTAPKHKILCLQSYCRLSEWWKGMEGLWL